MKKGVAMNTDDKLMAKEDHEIDESIKKPTWKNLPNLDERVKEALKGSAEESQADTSRDAVMPRIKGLDILKEGVYTVDLEKTINDMFVVIKSMETQLEKVLTINSHLEKDRNEAKEMVIESNKVRAKLESQIALLEKELPSKRELQMEIEQLVEERNSVQMDINEHTARVDKLQKTVLQCQSRIGNLEEEKGDAIAEINFLESKLNAASEKVKLYSGEIKELKGEKLAHVEKIKILEEDLKEALDDKFRHISELKKSQKAVRELHSAVSDKKLQAKKSFYQGTGEGKEST
jgi:chromosome segregation ATPase